MYKFTWGSLIPASQVSFVQYHKLCLCFLILFLLQGGGANSNPIFTQLKTIKVREVKCKNLGKKCNLLKTAVGSRSSA